MTQVMIALLGGSAIWLVGRTESWRRYGYLLGLLSQPFWLYSSWRAGQWGIFALSCWYTYSWTAGLRNHWTVESVDTVDDVDTVDGMQPQPQEPTAQLPDSFERQTGEVLDSP